MFEICWSRSDARKGITGKVRQVDQWPQSTQHTFPTNYAPILSLWLFFINFLFHAAFENSNNIDATFRKKLSSIFLLLFDKIKFGTLNKPIALRSKLEKVVDAFKSPFWALKRAVISWKLEQTYENWKWEQTY